MPLPVAVTIENCSATVASTGLVPIDGAIQWQDPTDPSWTDPELVVGVLTDTRLNLGAKGNFACELGTLATKTTRRIHCPGVPLDPGERVTGTIEAATIASTKFASEGDGLALLSGLVPELEFGATTVTPTRTAVRDWNVLREVQELDGRNATYGVYHQWRLSFWPTTNRVAFTVTASFTDERISDRLMAWPRIRIKIPVAWQLHVENSSRCPGTAAYVDGAYRYWDIVAAHTIHDAQSARFRGTFLVDGGTEADIAEWNAMPGNRVDVPRIICDPDEFRGKLYFYQGLPAKPLDFDTTSCRDRYNRFRDQLADRNAGVTNYTRWAYDSENNAIANNTGASADFAAGPFYECFIRDGGNPLRLPELDVAGERHMARPITQRRKGIDDADPLGARIVQWGDYLPLKFVLQSEYVFLGLVKDTVDVRGKSTVGDDNRNRKYFGGMTGLLRSHNSYLHAIEAMMLTGCFDAEDIVRQHIELFLYEWLVKERWSHSDAGQMRFARAFDMMAWSWLCTGDDRIVDRFREIEELSDQVFRDYPIHKAADHDWKTFGRWGVHIVSTGVNGNETRTLSGTVNDPWQIALSVGYYRAYQLTGRTFYQELAQDLTETWALLFRRGRYFYKKNTWKIKGPIWHTFNKVIYPGLNTGRGTYGNLPEASWLTEANDLVYWTAFDGNLWQQHMLCLAMSLHTSNRTLYDRIYEFFEQEYVPWRDAEDMTIFDKRGKWWGDDALIPGYLSGTDIEIDAGVEFTYSEERGFDFDTGGPFDFETPAEIVTHSEPALTVEMGPIELDAVAELTVPLEPTFSLDFDLIVLDIEVIADGERTTISEPGTSVELALDLGTYASETITISEPSSTFYEDLVADSEITTISEPEWVYDDGSQSVAAQLVRSVTGAATIRGTSGAVLIRGRGDTA